MPRRIAGLLAGLALAAAPLALAHAATGPDPVVQTTNGKLQGQPSKGVYSFLGVHYGADTGGKNRFLPPQPVAHWDGIKKASAEGDRCAQPAAPLHGDIAKILKLSTLPTSEDCLMLNVWTPHARAGGKRPVMVFLHGGGFFLGSGSDPYYEGSNLARSSNLVVITLNHRLNVFGYLALPDAGPAFADSGNAGMVDIVQALQWVRDNISAFGGDPANVTIFGQSGGGVKVSDLMAMPSARGLFAKAIIMSGPGLKAITPEQAKASTDAILAKLNLTGKDVAALQAVPADDLIKAAGGGMRLGPVIGPSLPGHPFDPAAPALSADIPTMDGTNSDEATSSLISDPAWRTMDDTALLKRVTAVVGEADAPKVIALYRKAAPGDAPMHLWSSISTDATFTVASIRQVELKSAQPAPVYMYQVRWRSPVLGGKLIRATHSGELPFVFDNVELGSPMVGTGPREDKMAKVMSRTFAAFARTGNPNVPGLIPTWRPYTLGDRATLIYDDEVKVVSDPNREKREFWEAFRARQDAK
jgi:para-nitrobenzyl esterase